MIHYCLVDGEVQDMEEEDETETYFGGSNSSEVDIQLEDVDSIGATSTSSPFKK